MAKNVQGVLFLRNGRLYSNHDEALEAIGINGASLADGQAILARYTAEDTTVKTIVGFKYVGGGVSSLTLIDIEDIKGDAEALVEALRTEINNKLGNGVTSANTATAQLAALSGGTFDPGTSSSAGTSVEGAKAYAYDLIGTLNYTDTAVAGSYVSEVTQSDGKIISTTKVELPSSADTAEAKKVVIAVAEDKGQIAVSRGTISSSAQTIVLTDNADGGVNFEVNIDGVSIVQDETTKKIKVADSALTQNYGDEKTIHATVDSANNTKTFSTLLQLSATTVTETNVKEQFNLVNASGETIGATIKIYKDSSLYNVYLGHVDDTIAGDPPVVTPGSGDTALCFIYHKEDGSYELVPVNVESFLEESEFESGVTATNHIVHGVVDPTSEKDSQDTPVDFLTVGANGFKVSGIKDEIDRKINALDATGGTQTIATDKHVAVEVVEANGLITAVTVTEDNIADADDLAALSAKTVTEIASSNASIAVSTATTTTDDGTVKYDIVTDADKILMSGFTTTTASSFSGIAEADSIATAFEKADAVITENERVTAAALNDLNDKIEAVSGASLSGVSVNNVPLTKANNAVNVQISGSTVAPSGTLNDPAIIVTTDNSTGAVTIGLGYIDCGTYDDE